MTRGVPTSGRISNGAIIERETGFVLANETNLRLTLRNPDLTTAMRIAEAVNHYLGAALPLPTIRRRSNSTCLLLIPTASWAF